MHLRTCLCVDIVPCPSPGFIPDPPTKHDPPLLFQIEEDPAERVRVCACCR